MVERTLELNYNLPIDYIFTIIAEDNKEIIEKLTDIFDYRQGKWNKNKRKDVVGLTLTDIPEELKTIASLFINNNQIYIKQKIKINERTEKKIIVNVKIKLINKLMNLMFKLFKYKLCIIVESDEMNNTNIKIIYKIKSLLSSTLTNLLDTYIEEKLKPKYINIIDEYLKSKIKNDL